MQYKLRTVASAFSLFLGVGLCLFMPIAASADSAEFQPNETAVSLETDMIDPEYNQETSQFTWVDSTGHLWIGKLDATGMFAPPSGKAILVDDDSMTTGDIIKITLNGPEWVRSADGPQIAYTKFPPNREHALYNGRLARAKMTEDGTWSYEFLSRWEARNTPYGSTDAGDPTPRITYVDADLKHYWRELDDAATEQAIPVVAPSKISVRLVPGTHNLLFRAVPPSGGISQVFQYDTDTQELEQLTYDDGDKGSNAAWMWQAPEYDNDYALFTVADGRELRIYRKLDENHTGTPVWTKVFSSTAPVSGKIGSPEPFVHNGHSYIFMMFTPDGYDFPTSIWLANIDPSEPIFRKISDDTLLRARTDPEVFVADKGPYIYYNRKDPYSPTGCILSCTEGIFRAYTGLPPADAP